MKRLSTVLATAAMTAAGVLATVGSADATPATAPTVSSASSGVGAMGDGYIYVYSGTNFSGTINKIPEANGAYYPSFYTKSLINNGTKGGLGTSVYNAKTYCFWAGGWWSYLGSPFSDHGGLAKISRGRANCN